MKIALSQISVFIVPGLIYGIGCLGLGLTFRYLKFPDFTILGSVISGSIVCIKVTNLTNPFLGIMSGIITGAILGFVTGILISWLKMQKVLASIITYTASFTISHTLAEGGKLDLKHSLVGKAIFDTVFRASDALVVFVILVAICLIIAFLMQTRFGIYLLAMSSSEQFLRYRHRSKNTVSIIALIIGNSIVGLCGAMNSLRMATASESADQDFLPIILGAVFGGNALILFFAHKLHSKRIDVPNLGDNSERGPGRLLSFLASIFSVEKEDKRKITALFFSYAIGTVFLYLIYGIVNSNVIVKIPFNASFIVIAAIIVTLIWWTGIEN